MENNLRLVTIADNEAYLRQKSVTIDIVTDEDLKNDINVLEQYCKSNEVMGMAAIQLGIPKRLIYLKKY